MRRRKLPFMVRALVYMLAFVVPPVLVAVVGLLGLSAVAALDRLVLAPATKRLRRPPKGAGA